MNPHTHEKAAGMLDTSATASETKRTAILKPQGIERKEFNTLVARFALRGYALSRVYRADDGRPTYHVTLTTRTHVFSHPFDLAAFLAVAEAKHGIF